VGVVIAFVTLAKTLRIGKPQNANHLFVQRLEPARLT